MEELKGKIFASLFILANRLQILGDKLDQNITVKQWLFIAMIYKFKERHFSVKELSKIMGTSHQNTMRMAKSLEESGFVLISKDESDKRIKRIALTSYCHEYFANREEKELNFLNQLFINFSAEEITQFNIYIDKMFSTIEDMEKI